MMAAEWDHCQELLGIGERLIESEVGPTNVFATELRHGLGFQKQKDDNDSQQSITAQLPAYLGGGAEFGGVLCRSYPQSVRCAMIRLGSALRAADRHRDA